MVLVTCLLCTTSTAALSADPPYDPVPAADAPVVILLKRVKAAYDDGSFMQESFFTEQSLDSFFEVTAIQWLLKDGAPPGIGKVAVIKSSLIPMAGEIRVSRLIGYPDGKNGLEARTGVVTVKGIALTPDQVTAVFGTPTERVSTNGRRLPLRYGDPDLLIHRPWDGSSKKGASFFVADDGAINGFAVMGTAPASAKQ